MLKSIESEHFHARYEEELILHLWRQVLAEALTLLSPRFFVFLASQFSHIYGNTISVFICILDSGL